MQRSIAGDLSVATEGTWGICCPCGTAYWMRYGDRSMTVACLPANLKENSGLQVQWGTLSQGNKVKGNKRHLHMYTRVYIPHTQWRIDKYTLPNTSDTAHTKRK